MKNKKRNSRRKTYRNNKGGFLLGAVVGAVATWIIIDNLGQKNGPSKVPVPGPVGPSVPANNVLPSGEISGTRNYNPPFYYLPADLGRQLPAVYAL